MEYLLAVWEHPVGYWVLFILLMIFFWTLLPLGLYQVGIAWRKLKRRQEEKASKKFFEGMPYKKKIYKSGFFSKKIAVEVDMGTDWNLEERPKRHRGAYKPELEDIPFELSRSAVEKYVQCPRCFYEHKVNDVKPPSIPAFLLNTNTDTLLKKDFDQYRGKGEPHPIMVPFGEHLSPYAHEDMEKWEQSIHFGSTPNHFNTWHRESNILFGGGLDDVWGVGISGVPLHIVDYKSTAQMGANTKPLDADFLQVPKDSKYPDYKATYRRQMDMYQWIMRRKGFEVSNEGYFLYVDGQHNGIDGMLDKNDPEVGWMKFNAAIIPYFGDSSWVEGTLMEIREMLDRKRLPPADHSKDCELGRYLNELVSHLT